jgi:hypothetical protein
MNNKLIGILIAFLYFTNYHICNIIYPTDDKKFWYLKMGIYSAIILLAIEYKKQNNFIEKLFIAIVLNNIYVLIRHTEIDYSIKDVFFILTFTLLQYVKHFFRVCNNRHIRSLANFFTIEKEKEK